MGDLTVIAGGAITQSGTVDVSGNASFTTDVNDMAITLADASNGFGGSVAFNTQGTTAPVSFVNNADTALTTSTVAGDLTITSSGDLTQSGALTVSGASSFTADIDDASILLGNTSNDFTGVITLTTQGTDQSHVVLADNSASTTLAASTVAGDLTVTAAGNVAQSGALTVAGLMDVSVTTADMTVTLTDASNAVAGAMSFDTLGTSGDVSIVNNGVDTVIDGNTINGDLTVDTDSALSFGATTVTGDLTATAGDAITQTGALTVGGNTTITTDEDDKEINLMNSGNAFTGSIDLNTQTAGGFQGHISLANSLPTTASGWGIGGILTIDSQAGLTFVGMTVPVELNLTASSGSDLNVGGSFTVGGDVNLTTDGGNINFNGQIDAGGNTVTVDTAGGDIVVVGGPGSADLVTTGTVDITANGIGASGAPLEVQDVTTLTVNQSGTGEIYIDEINNSSVTSTSLTRAASDGAVEINYNDGGSIVMAADPTQHSFTSVSMSSDLDYTASSGSITNTGTITSSGDISLTTSTADETITLTAVEMTGALGANTNGTGGDVSITAGSMAMDMGASNIGGDLTLVASSGDLTSSATVTVAGDANITSTGSSNIAMNNLAVSGAVNLASGADATITNAATTALGTVLVTGDLNVTSDQTITQSTPLTVSGNATFTTTGVDEAIVLNDPANAISGTVVFGTNSGGSTGDVTFINSLGSTEVGDSTVGGAMTIDVDGNTLILHDVTSTGALYFEGGSIITNSTYITFGAPVTFAGPVTIGGDLTLDTTALGTVPTGGDVTFTSTINGANDFSLVAGSNGDISIGDVMGGTTPLAAITMSGNDITVRGATSSDTQSYDAAGILDVNPTAGTDEDNRSSVTYTATGASADILFNPTGRAIPARATIVTGGDFADLVIDAGRHFTVGRNEKLSVIGELNVTAGDTITLSDTNTLNDLMLNAGNAIVVMLRNAGMVDGEVFGGPQVADAGTEMISGGIIGVNQEITHDTTAPNSGELIWVTQSPFDFVPAYYLGLEQRGIYKELISAVRFRDDMNNILDLAHIGVLQDDPAGEVARASGTANRNVRAVDASLDAQDGGALQIASLSPEQEAAFLEMGIVVEKSITFDQWLAASEESWRIWRAGEQSNGTVRVRASHIVESEIPATIVAFRSLYGSDDEDTLLSLEKKAEVKQAFQRAADQYFASAAGRVGEAATTEEMLDHTAFAEILRGDAQGQVFGSKTQRLLRQFREVGLSESDTDALIKDITPQGVGVDDFEQTVMGL